MALFSLWTQTPCSYGAIVAELCNLKSVLENSEVSEVRILETQ